MVTQKPIVGCKRAGFQRYSVNFYCKTCKNLQNPPFFGFFEVKSPHFDPEGASSQTSPAGGDPVQRYKQPLQNGAICTFPQGVKLGLPTCGRFRAKTVRGQGAATPQEVSSRLLALLAMKKSRRNQTHNGGTLLGGISPRPALAIPPPARTKEATTKDRKKSRRPPPRSD